MSSGNGLNIEVMVKTNPDGQTSTRTHAGMQIRRYSIAHHKQAQQNTLHEDKMCYSQEADALTTRPLRRSHKP